MKKILLMLGILLTASCAEPYYTPEFLTDDTIRLEIKDKPALAYTAKDCQYAYNLQRLEFRCHTDNMSDYFFIRLKSMPEKEGERVTAALLEWTTDKGMNRTRKNMEFEVVKMDGNTIWLWNNRESIKIALRFE